jgi:hypothetical protein
MRVALLLVVLAVIICFYGLMRPRTKLARVALSSDAETTTKDSQSKVDFTTQIKPILQQRCQPCHFSGGNMYAKLPFDRPETIKTLGTKLFTRLKDEKEQQLIRRFLAQN